MRFYLSHYEKLHESTYILMKLTIDIITRKLVK